MKNLRPLKKLTLLIFILLGNLIFSQTASRQCTTAVELTAGTYTNLTQDTSVAWFKFQATTMDFIMDLTNKINSSSRRINTLELFTANCGTGTLIAYDELSGEQDSVLHLEASGLTNGDWYKIKLTRVLTNGTVSQYSADISAPLGCGFEYWVNGNTFPKLFCTKHQPTALTPGSQCTITICCNSTLNVVAVNGGTANSNRSLFGLYLVEQILPIQSLQVQYQIHPPSLLLVMDLVSPIQ